MCMTSQGTLCKFFLNGCCVNGEMCTFAHGEHELQQPAEGACHTLARHHTIPLKGCICLHRSPLPGGTWVFIPSTASTKMGATSSWGAPASVSRKTQCKAQFGSCGSSSPVARPARHECNLGVSASCRLCAYFEAGFCKKVGSSVRCHAIVALSPSCVDHAIHLSINSIVSSLVPRRLSLVARPSSLVPRHSSPLSRLSCLVCLSPLVSLSWLSLSSLSLPLHLATPTCPEPCMLVA